MKNIQMKGKKRVKGTVLFTVVAVMFVLIVFLMSTLILTTSANRRSYYTYYQTQAQYATSAALDAITNYAYSDKDFSDWVTSAEVSDGNEHEIMVRFANTALPLSDSQATPDSVRCTVQSDKPHYTYDSVTGKIHEQKSWKITATAVVGAGRNQTSYSMVNYIYANVKTGDTSGRENTVSFNRYTYDQTLQNGSNPNGSPPSLATAMYTLGNVAGAGGGEGNMLVLGPQYSGMATAPVGRIKYNNTTTPTLTYDNNSAVVGNGVYVNNFYSAVALDFTFQNAGEGVQFWGNASGKNNNGLTFHSQISSSYAATAANKWDYKNLNYVYVDGTLSGAETGTGEGSNQGVRLGNSATDTMPINLYAGAINFRGANESLYVQGDVYLYDPALDSIWNKKVTTQLTKFVNSNISGKNSFFSGAGGNLICNNRSLELKDGLTIDGDLVFTNPKGTLKFGNNVTIKGNLYSVVAPTGTATVTGSTNIGVDAIKTAMGKDASTPPKDNYGKGYPAGYAAGATADYNYQLFPYAYRLDEIFTTYYRWDLADDANWATDPLIKESTAAGHTWTRESVSVSVPDYYTEAGFNAPITVTSAQAGGDEWKYANYVGSGYMADGSRITLVSGTSYNDAVYSVETKYNVGDLKGYKNGTISVPCTHPHDYNASTGASTNGFMKPLEIVTYSAAGSKVSKQTNTDISTLEAFQNVFAATKTKTINRSNIATYQKSMQVVYPVEGQVNLKAEPMTVYYINESCTLDVTGINGTILIDPQAHHLSSASPGIGIVLTGTLGGTTDETKKINILTNNTVIYDTDGTVKSVYGPSGQTDAATGKAFNGSYSDRTEISFFLYNFSSPNNVNGFDEFRKIIPTGIYDSVNKGVFDVVSNPLYPGQTGYSALTGDERWKFMFIPNSVTFAEANKDYNFDAIVMDTAMLLTNSTISTGGSRYVTGSCSYREEHSSTPYAKSGYKLLGLGTIVVKDVLGTNWPTTVYLGDAHRPNGSTPSTPEQNSTTGSDDRKPNSGDGKDYFNNDHVGAS